MPGSVHKARNVPALPSTLPTEGRACYHFRTELYGEQTGAVIEGAGCRLAQQSGAREDLCLTEKSSRAALTSRFRNILHGRRILA